MSEATIQFQGRLTGEPQQSNNQQYQVVNFNVAVSGSRQNSPTVFYRVAVWGQRGQWALNYLHKGDPVMVSGMLTNDRLYQRQDGQTGVSLEVNSDHVDFVLRAPRQNNNGGFTPQGDSAPQQGYQQPGQAPQAPQPQQQGNQPSHQPNQAGNYQTQGQFSSPQLQAQQQDGYHIDPSQLPFN